MNNTKRDIAFAKELNRFLETVCYVDDQDNLANSSYYESPSKFVSIFIKWSCGREQAGLSDLCPLTAEMVHAQMAKMGYVIGRSAHITGDHYLGLRIVIDPFLDRAYLFD